MDPSLPVRVRSWLFRPATRSDRFNRWWLAQRDGRWCVVSDFTTPNRSPPGRSVVVFSFD
jgi:hypothetical protein